MKISKKITALFIAVMMVVSMFPITAYAAKLADFTGNWGTSTTTTPGSNVKYTLSDTDSDGKYDKLSFTGSGAMFDNQSIQANMPWGDAGSYAGNSNTAGSHSNIKTVTIANGITNIGKYTCAFFTAMTSISIPNSVTTIGQYALRSCRSLTSITLPSNLTTIQNEGFNYCDKLTSVTIPSTVTSIGNKAFYDCAVLSTVTFARPSAAKNLTIGSNAFNKNVTTIAYSGSVGYDLYNNNTMISAGSAATGLNDKTLNWKLSAATVTFNDWDGTQLQSGQVAFGQTPTYNGETPTRASDEDYDYTFAGWSPSITAVTAAATYTATYTSAHNHGFMVGENWYDDFEEAVAAARESATEKTVICLSDIDLTSYAASARHYIDITGVTIDLNDHQMDVGTHWSVCFTGTNGKIMNGTCVGHDSPAYENYAYGIYIWGPGSGNVANSGGQKATIELEDLVCNYGIHCWNADVTIKDCDVTGSNSYYAVWADENTNVTIESGNFTTNGAAVLGAAKSSDGDGNISVEGGDFVVPAGKKLAQSGSSSKPENVKVSGGTFNVVVPVINCAENFVPVTEPNPQGKYVVEEATTGVILNGVNYETLEEAIAAAQDGDTITFVSDLTGNGISIPKNKFPNGLTVDFKGHTYTCNENYAGSTGTQRQVFQLNEGNTITFKNGTIESEGARMLIQNYADLTLDTMTLDHKGHEDFSDKVPYALSNNNGNVVIKDTTINACDDGFAFDACRYATYTSVNVTVTGDSEINGNVELSASGNNAKDGLSVNFVSGTLNGEVVLDPSAETAMDSTPAKAFVQKASTFVAAPPVGYMWDDETGKLVPSTAEDAYSITANDNIDLNFYIETETSDVDHLVITHSDPAKDNGSTITVTKPVATLETYVVPATATEPAKEYKVYKVNLAPAQLKDNIKISVYEDAKNVQRVIETSVDEYCRTILAMDDAALGAKATELKELAMSTLDYGKAASAYFEYNEGAFAGVSNELAEPDLNDERLYVAPGSNYAGISITGVSYVATTVPELRFTIDSSITENYLTELNETIETNIGEAKFVKINDGGTYRRVLQITNIDITDFGKQIVVTAGGNTILRFVPLTWAKSAAKSTTNAKVAALGKSICNYYIKSVEYFGIKA